MWKNWINHLLKTPLVCNARNPLFYSVILDFNWFALFYFYLFKFSNALNVLWSLKLQIGSFTNTFSEPTILIFLFCWRFPLTSLLLPISERIWWNSHDNSNWLFLVFVFLFWEYAHNEPWKANLRNDGLNCTKLNHCVLWCPSLKSITVKASKKYTATMKTHTTSGEKEKLNEYCDYNDDNDDDDDGDDHLSVE